MSTPALVIAGRGFLHLSGAEELSFPNPEKEALLATQPDVYRSTPHHDGVQPRLFVSSSG
jgi:hypothetical protein